MGQLITWLVPYQFSHDVSADWWNLANRDYTNEVFLLLWEYIEAWHSSVRIGAQVNKHEDYS